MSDTPLDLEFWLRDCLNSSTDLDMEGILQDFNLMNLDPVNHTTDQTDSSEQYSEELVAPPNSPVGQSSAQPSGGSQAFFVDEKFAKTLNELCQQLYGPPRNEGEWARMKAQFRVMEHEAIIYRAKNLELEIKVQGLLAENSRLRTGNYTYMPNASGLEFLITTQKGFKLYQSALHGGTEDTPNLTENSEPSEEANEIRNAELCTASSSDMQSIQIAETLKTLGGKQPRARYVKNLDALKPKHNIKQKPKKRTATKKVVKKARRAKTAKKVGRKASKRPVKKARMVYFDITDTETD